MQFIIYDVSLTTVIVTIITCNNNNVISYNVIAFYVYGTIRVSISNASSEC